MRVVQAGYIAIQRQPGPQGDTSNISPGPRITAHPSGGVGEARSSPGKGTPLGTRPPDLKPGRDPGIRVFIVTRSRSLVL